MITIDTYTANYCSARAAHLDLAPRVGSMVRMPEEPDGREFDDFQRVLRAAGLDYEFVRWMPRAKHNVYRVIRAVR